MLVYSVYRLTPITLDAFALPLSWYHWLVLIVNTLFMAYSEGYRGFQKGYSPRLVSRALELRDIATPVTLLLAPLYCMNYFAAETRRLVSAWVLTVAIILLIIVFHQLPQPWRGLLDAGVIVGLSWGFVATIGCWLNAQKPGNNAERRVC